MVIRKKVVGGIESGIWRWERPSDDQGVIPARESPHLCAGRRRFRPCALRLIALGLWSAAILVTGCAPRKVAIPPEWQTPPAQTVARPPQDAVSRPPAESDPGGPILMSTPSFREGNLPAGHESASSQAMKKPEPRAPQQLASMHLVGQAGTALSQGKPDAAIPLLEQAVQIDSYNGEAFLGLARAWKMKGSRNKAQEFAQKAEMLLQDQPSKLKEVYLFQAELFSELGDTRRMEQYRQKASKL